LSQTRIKIAVKKRKEDEKILTWLWLKGIIADEIDQENNQEQDEHKRFMRFFLHKEISVEHYNDDQSG
jgi:hypothetical protein